MQKQYTGVSPFDDGRFQRGRRGASPSPPADPAAGGGLPSAPPAQPAGTPSSALASGSVALSKLFQNLQQLNITGASSRPDNMITLAEALRKHFGDQAEIDVDGLTIKVKTPKGVRELEVFTQNFGDNDKRALLRLRVDKQTTRPIGNLVRYGDEYYINADLLKNIDNTSQPEKTARKEDDSQKPTDGKKPKRKLPKSVLYGAGLLAAGGAAVGLSRFLGGGDDDDDKNKLPPNSADGTEPLGTQVREEIVLNPANAKEETAKNKQEEESKQKSEGGEPPLAAGSQPPVTVTERPRQEIVVNVPPAKVIREITSGEAPVQTSRKGNETVVKAGTSDGVFTLNIGADKTLILKGKEVVGEFPTSDIIRAVGQMADGKTEKEIKRSGEFDDLLKNPWFLVAIALALVAFTRRGGRE